MNVNFTKDIAICYIACGPTFRETLLKNMKELYPDKDNLHYFILTDNKEYFKELEHKNLCIKDLEDYYKEFPEISNYEKILKTDDKNQYAKMFIDTEYRFPFSIMRFLLLEAYRAGIKDVVLLCTDTLLVLDNVIEGYFYDKKTIRNAVSLWYDYIWNNGMHLIATYLQYKHNLICDQKILVQDACARWFSFENLEQVKEFFDLWNDVITELNRSTQINRFVGSYVVNDEYILAPIYNAFGFNKDGIDLIGPIYLVNPDPKERFWRVYGNVTASLDYDEFLKINNFTND